MLRSNSKQAKKNIQNFIINVFNDYAEEEAATLAEAANVIFEDVRRVLNINGYVSQKQFDTYASYLPGYVETYGYGAHDDLAAILEETPEEAAKYTNQDAEKILTAIVYRELFNAVVRPYGAK